MVQLVGADNQGRSAIADSLGAFVLADVPDGRYMLGFFHPMLDSLGLEAPLREVAVTGTRAVRVDLGIPSARSVRAAICGAKASSDSSAVVMGVIRGANDRAPIGGVSVIGEWLELALTRGGYTRRVPRLVATTGPNGWFAMCNAPAGGVMVLTATRDRDSTDAIDVHVPTDGFLRRELYLGSARTVVSGDTTRTDSLAPAVAVRHVGDIRLTGVVMTAVGEQPLANAQVGVMNGPQTRANARGEWTLANAPPGTRMLEVRAVGYYPERRAIDVVADAPAIRTSLSTMRAVLDTVRVSATIADRNASGFEERRKTGVGTYITAADIARRSPNEVTDMFHAIAGVRIDRTGATIDTSLVDADPNASGTRLLMRGLMKDWCSPAIFMDGHFLGDLSVEEINQWVRPSQVTGIEIYRGPGIPPQFDRGMGGVGMTGRCASAAASCSGRAESPPPTFGILR